MQKPPKTNHNRELLLLPVPKGKGKEKLPELREGCGIVVVVTVTVEKGQTEAMSLAGVLPPRLTHSLTAESQELESQTTLLLPSVTCPGSPFTESTGVPEGKKAYQWDTEMSLPGTQRRVQKTKMRLDDVENIHIFFQPLHSLFFPGPSLLFQSDWINFSLDLFSSFESLYFSIYCHLFEIISYYHHKFLENRM